MIISKKTIMGPLLPLLLGDSALRYVAKTRLLGMTVDDNLTWVPHVLDLKKSFASKLELLKRSRFLPKDVLIKFYFSVILPSINYSLVLWGSCCNSELINSIDRLHCRAARIIFNLSKDDDVVHPNLCMKISTTQEEVEDILLRLNVHKASGVDGIPARILKIYAKELSWPLTYLFNLSFTLGEVPLIWKRANITPVFKANAKENVENYRSISLLSILGKCQERIVHRVVYSHVSPFLNGWQHGFVKGRSCITQLVLTHHMWHKALDDGLQVDAVFLDFTKAFDRVHHKILLNKLCNFGISGSLLEWCSDYLLNRTQRVVIDGNCSTWLNIPSGVPQGSISGPLFFVIFISDLPEVVSVGNTLAMYADDCKPVRHSV